MREMFLSLNYKGFVPPSLSLRYTECAPETHIKAYQSPDIKLQQSGQIM